jgi:hypothetical protein
VIAFTIRTVIGVNNISTTISTIIIAICIIGLIITETISNYRGSKPSNTVFLIMTSTFRAVIRIDVDTAITTIIEATRIVSLIIAYTISNQCDVTSTI